MKKNMLYFFATFFTALFISVLPVKADLLVSPLRVVFEDSTRTAAVSLINDSKETRTYRIDTVEKKMKPEGGYEDLKEKPSFAASPYIKFSPTQVTLRPGESQSIRISLRKPETLADGEYHSHLLFKRLDNAKPESEKNEKVKGMNIQLYLNLSFAIPIIIRNNTQPVTAKIVSANFNTTTPEPTLDVSIDRIGNASTFGRIQVYNSEKEPVGLLNNTTLFAEINNRVFNVPLKPEAMQSSELYVVYEGLGEYSGVKFDQKTLKLK